MLSLLPESQKKEISSAEKKLADSGQEIFKLHKQKEVQNRDYNTVMNKFRNERKELQKSLKNYKEGSTEYKEAHKKLESLEKTIDLKVKKHNQFEKNLHLKEQDHIKLRKNLDTTRTKAGIKLNINDSFTAGQQSKADVVDNMYVGKIPPGTSSVEDMISKAKLTGEIAKSNISLSQLKEANSIGTTITVGDIKELGGTQKGAQGFTQGSRIVLSDKGVSGTVTHEMAHVVQNRKIVDVNGKVNKLYEAKKKTGGFASKYSAKSEKEYFAEGVRLYNSASGRKELKEKDPSLHSLMKDLENKGKLKDGIKQRSFEGEQPESADILKQWDKKPSEKISSTLGTEKDYFILQGGKAGKLKETVGDKIHKAMVGNKKDEKTILNVLKEDGNTAVKDYREKYGRDLLKDLKSELGETGWKKAEHVLSKGKDNQITRQEASTKQTSGQIKTEQVQKASTGESQHQKVTVQKQDSQQSVPQQPTLSKSTEAKLEKGKITLPGKKINKQMSRKTVIEQSTAHKVETKETATNKQPSQKQAEPVLGKGKNILTKDIKSKTPQKTDLKQQVTKHKDTEGQTIQKTDAKQQGSNQKDVKAQIPDTKQDVNIKKDIKTQISDTKQQVHLQKDIKGQTLQKTDVKQPVQTGKAAEQTGGQKQAVPQQQKIQKPAGPVLEKGKTILTKDIKSKTPQKTDSKQQATAHKETKGQTMEKADAKQQVSTQKDVKTQIPDTKQDVNIKKDTETLHKKDVKQQTGNQKDVKTQIPDAKQDVNIKKDVKTQLSDTKQQVHVHKDIKGQTLQKTDVKQPVQTGKAAEQTGGQKQAVPQQQKIQKPAGPVLEKGKTILTKDIKSKTPQKTDSKQQATAHKETKGQTMEKADAKQQVSTQKDVKTQIPDTKQDVNIKKDTETLHKKDVKQQTGNQKDVKTQIPDAKQDVNIKKDVKTQLSDTKQQVHVHKDIKGQTLQKTDVKQPVQTEKVAEQTGGQKQTVQQPVPQQQKVQKPAGPVLEKGKTILTKDIKSKTPQKTDSKQQATAHKETKGQTIEKADAKQQVSTQKDVKTQIPDTKQDVNIKERYRNSA